MTDFLTAVKTISLSPKPATEEGIGLHAVSTTSTRNVNVQITSPDDALQVLRSQPDQETLLGVLQYLIRDQSGDFNIRRPDPSSARLVNELVASTIPDYCESIGEEKALSLSCLRSVAGVGALLSRIKLLTSQIQARKKADQSRDTFRPIIDLISVLDQVLNREDLACSVWQDIVRLARSPAQQTLVWKEFIGTIASGRIISAIAQAEDVIGKDTLDNSTSWLSVGSKYSAWLGRNVAVMALSIAEEDQGGMAAAGLLCSKGFGIGYAARMIEAIHQALAFSSSGKMAKTRALITHLRALEQARFLELTFSFATQHYDLYNDPAKPQASQKVGAAAALIHGIIGESSLLLDQLVAWLSDPALASAEPVATQRAALSALSANTDCMQTVMEATLKLFGENLFIKHAPVVQQETCAQILLVSAGYVHRANAMFLFTLARSSYHLSGTSNRLHASSPRARMLGMCVSMAVSSLVDKPGQRMNFGIDDVKSPEALALMSLVNVNDPIGSADDLSSGRPVETKLAVRESVKGQGTPTGQVLKPKPKPSARQVPVAGPRVIEVMDEDEEEDDLIPYAKPDSDPEDEDEDPTLVNRNKLRAPVYIRDLISGLQDSEKYDRHFLALTNAASLIRRKAQFGKEVSDHAQELAIILTGLGDTFETENFSELRLQALIAVLLSNPAQMAPWFARQVFDGDYSLSQRATVLSVLGLGARELAGFHDADELNPRPAGPSFPSKALPGRFHAMYSGEQSSPVEKLALSLEQTMISPMALQAADKLSGPNALKVRTFSSRMEVEKKRKRAIPNALAKVVAEAFFFPLTGRWWQNVQAYGASNIHFQPFLLATYVKTLALLLHASGPSTLSLPQMTAEFWDLLLNVRANALGDVAVLEAVLFALLTLLEVNEDKRRVAEEHSRQLLETQEWVELVFEKTSGGDQEGERIRMFAASVLLKTREVVEKYQRLLVGDMMEY